VEVDPRLFRPAEVEYLLGDATKARQKLDWTPQTTFEELVHMMVEHDLQKSMQANAEAKKSIPVVSARVGVV